MEKVRIGNDIQVKYTVLRDGLPESFVGATDITVTVTNEAYKKAISNTFDIVGNIVNISIDAADFNLCGKYRVTLKYVRGNDIEIDALAFEGVQYTSLTGGTEIVGVEVVTVNISGDIGIAIPDNNKIDLDGLNSNIDKLHFKPDTLVQLAEIGDVRYSTESKTLEVKVSDTVSIQLGQEMQTRVKNDAGVQIDNGQLVYINSAASANPLAKIASTTDANIAQRTFGMATENIASNGFGAITTEGLVRDVNTASFTEGDMLWLGVNGTVTNIEPVAPTPKISVGMVLRSNVANGVIYVKIRAISRNQKLSDVYAPTLTGGDILRWNSTTLRFETFNVTTALAGKADLVGGKIPTSQLPSYVDDVLEYTNLSAFPATGETGKIYVALDTNLTYRWSGTAYVEISKSLALGETSSTAYRGDRGKTAYDHSQTTGNAHGTTAAQIPNAPAGTVVSTTVQGAINELASDIVQVETDLNETDIKNAEQDASIKSIEQLLSQSNLNQTAQISSTGREVVSLQKTASNGGMEVKLEGLTATQLITNGNFSTDANLDGLADGWEQYGATGFIVKTVSYNTQYLKSGTSAGFRLINQFTTSTTDLFYITFTYKTGSSTIGFYTNARTILPSSTTFVRKSFRTNLIVYGMRFSVDGFAENDELWLKNAILINLTSTFGAGNEPDLATCDTMFSTYFEGTKSFVPTGRLKSVGKNLFDKSRAKIGYFVVSSSGNLGVISTHISSDFIRVNSNTTYTKSINTGGLSGTVAFYDANKVFISYTSTSTFTTPLNAAYLRFDSPIGNLDVINLKKESVATTYDPYKSTKLYLTAPDLRSNGLVKDEVRKGANGYEHVKRVGVGTLGSNIVLNGGFDSTDNWIVPADRASIANSALNIDVTTWATDVRQNCNLNVGYYLAEFDIISVARGGTLTIHSDNAVYNSIGVAGRYRHIFYCKTAGLRALYVNSENIACSIDNISVRQIITSDIPTLISPVISTSILPIVADNYIRFPIETPIITPIEHAGIINSAESGTVYHEPVLADAGVYGTNLAVFNTTYPISSLEEIMVHTAVDTYLDVSKAVIASDGLSFTHPDLRAGDLALFTYFFNKEKVNGLVTATYYDGRYVIADTSNGKFYKWGVKSTNGVATIQLTEV